MKLFSMAILAVITMAASNALACAMCADIYTEVIVLDAAATKQLRSHANLAKGEVLGLSSVVCVKPNRFVGSKEVASCKLEAFFEDNAAELSLSGDAAVGLHSQLMHLTVEQELMGESDDTPERTGERSSPVMISQTPEKTTATLSSIHTGSISCPKVKGSARCEIELKTLNAVNFGD